MAAPAFGGFLVDALDMIARCMAAQQEAVYAAGELGLSQCSATDAAWIVEKSRELALPVEPMGDPEAS
jgi:hypothetical protein